MLSVKPVRLYCREKTVPTIAAVCLLLAALSVPAAENLIQNGGAEEGFKKNWTGFTAVSDDAHQGAKAFHVTGKQVIRCAQLFPIDPMKTYDLSLWAKSLGSEPSSIYFGFAPRDEKKRTISPHMVNVVPKTETELAEACQKTDTVLKIKDGKGWKAHNFGYVAFEIDSSPAMSDLPNRNLSGKGVKKVTQKDGYWEVELGEKCGQAYPAGTPVREHLSGATYMYTGGANKGIPMEWTKVEGQLAKNRKMRIGSNNWWPGTKFAQVIIFTNLKNPEGKEVLIDEITVTESD